MEVYVLTSGQGRNIGIYNQVYLYGSTLFTKPVKKNGRVKSTREGHVAREQFRMTDFARALMLV